MKQKFSIGLIVMIVLGTLLMPILIFPLKAIIFEAKQEILLKLDPASVELTRIDLTAADFSKMQLKPDAEEMSYSGSMYDIFSVTKKDGVYTILAIKDESENALFALFTKPGENKQISHSLVFFCFLSCPQSNISGLELMTNQTDRFSFLYRPFVHQKPVVAIFSPPPNFTA